MPEPGVPVLVATGNHVTIAYWLRFMGRDGDFAVEERRKNKRVLTHLPYVCFWMSLPEPPK